MIDFLNGLGWGCTIGLAITVAILLWHKRAPAAAASVAEPQRAPTPALVSGAR